MSKINYQALREAAEQAMHDYWGFDADLFHELVTPSIVLALLDERERNQQYIKRRDQENENIALTVGRLRVELEAAKKRICIRSPVRILLMLLLTYRRQRSDFLRLPTNWHVQLYFALLLKRCIRHRYQHG